MSYLSERFKVAIFALVGEGPIKQRLAEAYIEHLGDLDSEEFPSDLRQDFMALHDALHYVRPGGKDSCIRASIRKMSAMEADIHAEMIVRIYSELLRNDRVNDPLSIVSKKDNKPLPRFLASVD